MMTGWQTKTLGDVCHVYQPETISQKRLVAGDFPVYGANGRIGWHNRFNHEAPQLILGCRGSCGTVHFTEPCSWINGNAMVVEPKPDVIDVQFLAYALKGGVDISDAITGAAQPQITRTSLMPVAISFPRSIAEQQRIVGTLDVAFGALAGSQVRAERNLRSANALFENHLRSIFAQRGAGWSREKLGDLCDIKHGFAFDGASFSTDAAGGKPLVVTPGNFTEDGKLVFNAKNTKWLRDEPPAAFRFDVGDLVVVMTDLSSKMKILGKPAFVDRDDLLHNQRIGRFLFSSNTVDKRFVYYFMMSAEFLKSIRQSATGTMVKHTAPSRILRNVIAFPPDVAVQRSIVAELDHLRSETQRLGSIYQQKLAALAELKKSLLHQAFTGAL